VCGGCEGGAGSGWGGSKGNAWPHRLIGASGLRVGWEFDRSVVEAGKKKTATTTSHAYQPTVCRKLILNSPILVSL
jgi:hypothetical protein